MKQNISDWVASVLVFHGVQKVFVYPGGTIIPLINACLKANISVECFKSEQGAGYAALAYARLTGRVQVVMVTSGPGATNAITPLADAYYDSTPLVLITGQIGTGDLTIRENVRQRGFQETPTVAITDPISKHSVCLLSAEDVYRELPDAFRIATTGRKGPCVIDFPMNIQREKTDNPEVSPISLSDRAEGRRSQPDVTMLSDISQVAVNSRRPVLLLGHGALTARAYEKYTEIASRLDALVVTNFLGVGSFDSNDQRWLGYIGHTGHLVANRAVFECDFLLVLGSRLDIRQTGTEVDRFVPNGTVAWIDIDANELLDGRVDVTWKMEANLIDFCDAFIDQIGFKETDSDKDWQDKMLAIKSQQLDDIPLEGSVYLQPRPIMNKLASLMKDQETVVVTGVGCHQHWTARHLPFKPDTHLHLTSGGHGTMGYDLPSAIGAAMVYPEKPILCVVGDGSLLMNIQELASLQERQLNVKILVLNNSRLGLVSQFQLITWGNDPITGDFQSPDFKAIAHGFGIASDHLHHKEDITEKLTWFWQHPGPVLLDVAIDPAADVTPLLLAGQHMGEMWMGRES